MTNGNPNDNIVQACFLKQVSEIGLLFQKCGHEILPALFEVFPYFVLTLLQQKCSTKHHYPADDEFTRCRYQDGKYNNRIF